MTQNFKIKIPSALQCLDFFFFSCFGLLLLLFFSSLFLEKIKYFSPRENQFVSQLKKIKIKTRINQRLVGKLVQKLYLICLKNSSRLVLTSWMVPGKVTGRVLMSHSLPLVLTLSYSLTSSETKRRLIYSLNEIVFISLLLHQELHSH